MVFFPSFTTFSGALAFGIEDNTKIFSLSFLVIASISACVSSMLSLLNIFLAFSKSILIAAKVDSDALSLLIFSISSSTFSILVCNFVLSNTTCFSTVFSVLELSFIARASLADTFSFLAVFSFSLSDEILLFRTSVFPSFELTTFSTAVSFSIFSPGTSPAFAIPAPKNILAPITTDAAPTLNFLIE